MSEKEKKEKIRITVITPEKRVFEGYVDYISLPSISGSLGILPKHMPIITKLKIGILKLVNEGNATYIGVCRGHFEFFGKIARVLTERAIITAYEDRQATIAELKKKHDITQEITEETKKVIQAIAGLTTLKK
ncbi:MAG: ATP synthase F1 subunit epsilon [Actinobacteria bacterium]|nr:ATP synthase F1 subunit epsilon [Actinomycetota bacterium]